MTHRPYTIITPDFEVTSGGIRVMYGLYGWLLARGQIVHLNSAYNNTDFVAIYPEIVQGNPANAKHVVRYILNKPGVMQSRGIPGPTSFDKSDHLYIFSKMFNTPETEGAKLMFLPIIDTFLFKDYRKKRPLRAVFVGKGANTGVHPSDCVPIDRAFSQDQAALALLLNECQVLYSYDPVSAMTEIARLCGCRVVMLQDTYTKDDYKNYEPGLNGMSFGLDEEVPLDTEGFREHYSFLKRQFAKKLDRFIEDTQK